MQRFFLFLLKFNGLLAFLVCQFIALSIYFGRNSNPEKQAFLSSANGMIGSLYESTSSATRYWNLSEVNDRLARENAELRMRLPSSKFTSLVQGDVMQDTTLQQHYRYNEAKVVNNTIHRQHNFLTINRGRKQGLVPNSGVINGDGSGIIGIVQKVSKNYGVVMSILNTDIRISAKLWRTNSFGMLSWDGLGPQYMTLESVPKHAEIQQGDTVVTSGYSTVFPENIPIGEVDTFYKPPGLNFYHIRVALFNDLNRAQYVYVVTDLLKEERFKLEKAIIHD